MGARENRNERKENSVVLCGSLFLLRGSLWLKDYLKVLLLS